MTARSTTCVGGAYYSSILPDNLIQTNTRVWCTRTVKISYNIGILAKVPEACLARSFSVPFWPRLSRSNTAGHAH